MARASVLERFATALAAAVAAIGPAAAVAAIGPAAAVAAIGPAAAIEEPAPPAADRRLERLKGAEIFEGAGVGFAGRTSAFRRDHESLLAEGRLEPFLTLASSTSPAAVVYGIDGLAQVLKHAGGGGEVPGSERDAVRLLEGLLDDEREVHLFLSCEHHRSLVAVEAFKALAGTLVPEAMDRLAADLIRRAAAERSAGAAGSAGRESAKLRLALGHGRHRPGAAYLGFLLHEYHDRDRGAALLDPAPLASPGLRARRLAIIGDALQSEAPELRRAALGAAREAGAELFLEAIAQRADDTEAEVAVLAIDVLADAAASAIAGGGAGPRAREATALALQRARSGLAAEPKRRDAGARAILRLAAAIEPPPAAAGAGESPAPAPPGADLRAAAADVLLAALTAAPELGPEIAAAMARIDIDGGLCLRALEDPFGGLDPRAFERLAARAGEFPASRARLLERLRAVAADGDAPWKMRLYSVRGLGELRDPQARDLLERLRAGDDARLSREAAEAAAKIEAGGKRPGP
jgi:hypothetical protein